MEIVLTQSERVKNTLTTNLQSEGEKVAKRKYPLTSENGYFETVGQLLMTTLKFV
jgi:hypothetical protein